MRNHLIVLAFCCLRGASSIAGSFLEQWLSSLLALLPTMYTYNTSPCPSLRDPKARYGRPFNYCSSPRPYSYIEAGFDPRTTYTNSKSGLAACPACAPLPRL